jgi:type IV secretion system protein VirD4
MMSDVRDRFLTLVVTVAVFASACFLSLFWNGYFYQARPFTTTSLWLIATGSNLWLPAILGIRWMRSVPLTFLLPYALVGAAIWYSAAYVFPPEIKPRFLTEMGAARLQSYKSVFWNFGSASGLAWNLVIIDLLHIFVAAFGLRPLVTGEIGQKLKPNSSHGQSRNSTAKAAQARWASKSEVKKHLGQPEGIIIGEYTDPLGKNEFFDPRDQKSKGTLGKGMLMRVPLTRGNGHFLIISESGGFKSSGIVTPAINSHTEALSLLDPKCVAYQQFAPIRRAMGRNPIRVCATDGIDPLRMLKPLMEEHPSVYYELAANLVPEAERSSENSTYFRERSIDLLSGLLYHFVSTNVPDVAKSVLDFLSQDMDSIITQAHEIASKSDKDFVRMPLLRVQLVDAKGIESLIRPTTNKFKFAEFPDVRGYVTEKNGSNKAELALDPNSDIFLEIPSSVLRRFEPVARIIFASLLIAAQLRETPEKPSTRRLLIIDEAKGLGNMDILEMIRDEGRGYGLHLMMIYQSWPQMVKIWGESAKAWEETVTTRIYGAIKDGDRARQIQNQLGKDTIRLRTHGDTQTQRVGVFNSQSSTSQSEQIREMPLLTIDEIANLPPHAALIFTQNVKPILASKAIHFLRKDLGSKKARNSEPTSQEPVAHRSPQEAGADLRRKINETKKTMR